LNSSTEQHRLECEARYWKAKVRQKGRGWWESTKKEIAKKRGEAGLQYLLAEMNKQAEGT